MAYYWPWGMMTSWLLGQVAFEIWILWPTWAWLSTNLKVEQLEKEINNDWEPFSLWHNLTISLRYAKNLSSDAMLCCSRRFSACGVIEIPCSFVNVRQTSFLFARFPNSMGIEADSTETALIFQVLNAVGPNWPTFKFYKTPLHWGSMQMVNRWHAHLWDPSSGTLACNPHRSLCQ